MAMAILNIWLLIKILILQNTNEKVNWKLVSKGIYFILLLTPKNTFSKTILKHKTSFVPFFVLPRMQTNECLKYLLGNNNKTNVKLFKKIKI